ncbi:MAG: hypothetical protein HY549_09165 [Elusimicrobia bacterium]|nr:hypothetical protein [Elusimicrobiota bacterium]
MTAVKGAVEAAALSLLSAAAASVVWHGPGEPRSIVIGAAAAWTASTLSAGALTVLRAVSSKAFWWAFGGGMALRLAALSGLMAHSLYDQSLSAAAMLMTYVFGVLGCLMIEYRRLRPT